MFAHRGPRAASFFFMRTLLRSVAPLSMATALAIVLSASQLAGCGKKATGPAKKALPDKPVETRPPNAPHQQPAFEGQTRAPFRTANVAFDVRVVARDLDHPWAVAFLPD